MRAVLFMTIDLPLQRRRCLARVFFAAGLTALAGRLVRRRRVCGLSLGRAPRALFRGARGSGNYRTLDPDLTRIGEFGSETDPIEQVAQVGPPLGPTATLRDARKPLGDTKQLLLSTGVILGSAASSLFVGHEHQDFHFTNEGWFQDDTYAGGADKASHFVFYNGLSRELTVALRDMGYEKDRAITAPSRRRSSPGSRRDRRRDDVYGFSWEDLTMDTLGAGTAALITHYGLDDTVGFASARWTRSSRPSAAGRPGSGRTTRRRSTPPT